MKALVIACCIAIGASFPLSAAAQPKAKAKKGGKPARVKIERLTCRLGTEDQHARIAVELANGKVDNFAYYSKWKPRTCSMDVRRGDAYSKWEDTGAVTVVTLIEEKGAFLIDHERNQYKFIFRDIDRMRYCGMEGKVNGSLTISRGNQQCVLEGVMDLETKEPFRVEGPIVKDETTIVQGGCCQGAPASPPPGGVAGTPAAGGAAVPDPASAGGVKPAAPSVSGAVDGDGREPTKN